jgi:GntR family transcriptional regulator
MIPSKSDRASSIPVQLRPVNRLVAGVPLYIQIAEGLLNWVDSGRLAPGDRLPAERDLSQTLGVNRMTLRRALELLAAQGLLERRQGAGTYIADRKIERQAGQLVSFTKRMREQGFTPGARVVSFEERPCGAALAAALRLPTSAPVYDIRRLRFLNGQPVLLEHYTLPIMRFSRLAQYDLEHNSLYEVLHTHYGVDVHRARLSLEAVLATAYESEQLLVPLSAPLMLERRLSYDALGAPVEHGEDHYRGDRFQFVTETAALAL